MSYIILSIRNILSKTGMPFQAVFLSTIIATVVSTLVMGLFATSFTLAPGMGLNAFFTLQLSSALIYLARSISNGIHLWFIQYFYYCNKVCKMIISYLGQYATCHRGARLGFHRVYRFLKCQLLEFLSDSKTITQVNGAAYNVATEEAYKGGVFSVNSNGGIVPSLVNFTSPGALLCSYRF